MRAKLNNNRPGNSHNESSQLTCSHYPDGLINAESCSFLLSYMYIDISLNLRSDRLQFDALSAPLALFRIIWSIPFGVTETFPLC